MGITIRERNGTASIWIDDWNVCDVPHEEARRFVEFIRRAYVLGRRHAREEALDAVSKSGGTDDYSAWVDVRRDANSSVTGGTYRARGVGGKDRP